MVNKDESLLLDGVDILLSVRESKAVSLKKLNFLINKEINKLKRFPKRWYVNNPSDKIKDYIKNKYNLEKLDVPENCGIGELHEEYAFIPHDIDYSWEITELEFNIISNNING